MPIPLEELNKNFLVAAPDATIGALLDRLPTGRDQRVFMYVVLPVAGGRYVVVRWRQRVGEVIDSSPAIGDIDGDGRPEAVVGTGVFYGRTHDVPDSTGRRGAPVAAPGRCSDSPSRWSLVSPSYF